MKVWKRILTGMGIFVLVVLGIGWYFISQQQKDMNQLQYSSIDMNLVKDGLYEGEVETMLIKVKVHVEVNNHSIKDIKMIKHDNGLGSQAESMINVMKENNTYDVDTVSKATLSSQVIKSAVSQALEKGL